VGLQMTNTLNSISLAVVGLIGSTFSTLEGNVQIKIGEFLCAM